MDLAQFRQTLTTAIETQTRQCQEQRAVIQQLTLQLAQARDHLSRQEGYLAALEAMRRELEGGTARGDDAGDGPDRPDGAGALPTGER